MMDGSLSTRRLLWQAFLFLTAIMCSHILITCLVMVVTPSIRFPWYAPVYLLGMIYIIPVLVLGGLNLLLWLRERF